MAICLGKKCYQGISLQRSGMLKGASFSLWLLAVAVVIGAIQHQDRFFAVDNRPVATLQSKTGQVLVRSEGLVRWQEAGERHGFLDGDRVATVKSAARAYIQGEGK